MPRYTGSRSYRLFLYPSRLSFSFSSAGRAPRRSPYCDSVIVVRFWKIAHCESILKTGGSSWNPPRRFLRISGTCCAERSNKTDRMLIFLRLTSPFISFLPPFHTERTPYPSCISYPDTVFHPWILGFSIRDGLILSKPVQVALRKSMRYPANWIPEKDESKKRHR